MEQQQQQEVNSGKSTYYI